LDNKQSERKRVGVREADLACARRCIDGETITWDATPVYFGVIGIYNPRGRFPRLKDLSGARPP